MKPLWISHRGLKEAAVENTVQAFRDAVEAGFGVLETDLRLTRDGHVVLHHDPDLRRLAGSKRKIAGMTRSDLELVPLGPDGAERLLFLDAFLDEFAACEWTFDIKPETAVGVIDALLAIVRAGGTAARKIASARFVTWDARHEARLQALFPAARCYARERECWRAGLAVIAGMPALGRIAAGRVYSLPPRLGQRALYTPEIVAAYHARGARLMAFLPETDDEARQAAAAGFDEILTNGRILANP